MDLAEAPTGVLSAEVRGLSDHPADILNDLYPRSDLGEFRGYCTNAGLTLGGALTEQMTIRAAVQFVCDQVGAGWSAGRAGCAAPFPPSATDPQYATFSPLTLSNWSAETDLATVVTRLTVPFDWDYAAGKSQQSVVLEAAAATATHGERAATLSLPWVKDARQAVATATVYLQWRARPIWTVRFSAGPACRDIPPGGWIHIDHSGIPYAGDYVVMDIDPGYGRGGVTITAQAAAGHVPSITLVQSSAAF